MLFALSACVLASVRLDIMQIIQLNTGCVKDVTVAVLLALIQGIHLVHHVLMALTWTRGITVALWLALIHFLQVGFASI